MGRADRWIGTGLVAGALALWWVLLRTPVPAGAESGRPLLWPRVILVLLALSGGVLVLSGYRRAAAPAGASPGAPGASPVEAEPPAARRRAPGNYLAVLASFAFPFLMTQLGFFLTTFLYLLAAMYLLKERRVAVLAGVPLGICLLVLLVFVRLFYVPLPAGVGIFQALSNQIMFGW